MGRNRTFDEDEVVERCAEVFRRTGYEGSSIDDLVAATGLHRGSLYSAFGSKRGLFVLALRRSTASGALTDATTDLVLVALMELAWRDPEIRSIAFGILDDSPGDTATTLGRRLIDRAVETPDHSDTRKETS